ncbi:hypothetical protein Bpfe_026758, partial [Biomphalaria pfeifferi]
EARSKTISVPDLLNQPLLERHFINSNYVTISNRNLIRAMNNNYLRIGTLLCIVSIVSSQNVTVTYVEDGVSLYRGSGFSSGCYLNLGCFPYWCLGNISLCRAGFSLTFWIKAYSDVSPDLDPQVLLTSGGHRTNNEG